jgi:hypothetical protein
MLAAVSACAVLAGPVAGAQASNLTIAKTFKASQSKIDHDEANVLNGFAAYNNGKAAPLEHALRHEVTDIMALRSRIDGESASSTHGDKGKTMIVKGLGMIAFAYSALAAEVQKSSSGHPVSRKTVNATVAADKKGRTKLIAGLKLL